MAGGLACDVTYLVEGPPQIEYRGGLFYLTDHLGGQSICRAMRPSTLRLTIHNATVLLNEFRDGEGANVSALPND
jgi:hypothetical protein